MIKLKKKDAQKPQEKLNEDAKEVSSGKLLLKTQFPEFKNTLGQLVPQAKIINVTDVMNFKLEYTPEKDSLWYGGKYVFSFSFPDDFPYNPPKVLCETKIYHPNIAYNGSVCLNILKEDWKPTMDVSNCAAGVYSLFLDPNPNDPLNHEVANVMRDNFEQFKENIKKTMRGGYLFGQQFPRFK